MYKVNTTKCSGCGSCIEICPFDAIYLVDDNAQIDEAKCRTCRKCLDVCPNGAIVVTYESQPKSIPVYAERSKIEFTQSKATGKVPQQQGLLSSVMDFLNRIIIPHNEWSQKDTPYENHSQYVPQRKNNSIIGNKGIYGHRGGRDYGRKKRARGRR